jgi:hypothetical protein
MDLSKNLPRQEIKYKVFYRDLGKLYAWLFNAKFNKSFDNRNVNSLYYDTPNLDFAADNISGDSKRIKIRARWYSKFNENIFDSFSKKNQSFNIEVKRKKNNLSDKIILSNFFFDTKNTLIERRNLINDKVYFEISKHPELLKLIIKDIIFVGYKREYYENFISSKIRLTIDKNLVCSNNQSFFNFEKSFISKNYVIVELKFSQDSFQLIKKILNNFPFRQVRSSKYLYALSNYQRFSY